MIPNKEKSRLDTLKRHHRTGIMWAVANSLQERKPGRLAARSTTHLNIPQLEPPIPNLQEQPLRKEFKLSQKFYCFWLKLAFFIFSLLFVRASLYILNKALYFSDTSQKCYPYFEQFFFFEFFHSISFYFPIVFLLIVIHFTLFLKY